jgi:periplasmic protein TonB
LDAVGEVLAERQRSDLPWGFGATLAFLLHAAIGATLVLSALHHPVRFVTPRAVNVRLVQAGRLQGGTPAAAPEAPPPEKPKIIKPAEEPPPPPPSKKALLLPTKEKEKEKKPAVPSVPGPATKQPNQQAPAASAPPSAQPGTGGPVGSGGNVGIGGATFDQPDFNYSYYVERMLVTIGMNWFKPAESVPISPMIRFRIERDGTINDPQIERSSGLPFVDRAALRAVMASSPLPPLPQEFGGKYLGVHLIFE